VFDGRRTIVAKGAHSYIKPTSISRGAHSYIKPTSISRGAQVYLSKHKEYKENILQQGGHKSTLASTKSIRSTFFNKGGASLP
jgi:hypothetical protein